ncbi:MAG: hypothetical protein AAF688_04345 [Bacteroidota bacterium]
MTKEELMAKSLDLNCSDLKDDKIVKFKLKVPGSKTVFIKGDRLNSEANKLISKAKIETEIQIFDVMLASKKKIKPITVTIID